MKKLLRNLFGKKQMETETEVRQSQLPADDEKHSYRYFLQYKFIPDLVAGVS